MTTLQFSYCSAARGHNLTAEIPQSRICQLEEKQPKEYLSQQAWKSEEIRFLKIRG